ncbi:Uncharacterised protein [Yersinia rohdei]|uniref:Lipoprotein n=1 Tax=Yersinia rohdei TaxID=29485 RepID=A0A0U1HYD1_YERRO|nr:hypothetical protein [Yersinia rohdei]OWF77588.1 hypothetical protein B4900_16165 [Yersinia rohdei]CNE12323.1 Uncharacterised protein [Yersinia rohdei]CNI39520.1 Uncharacterised protein [Yersinia rohdei]CQI98019.1 Uncharacterised protein [Yersinia rohdei]CQJ56152.1 Uncharacterised protein [Yersinia rohdei]
MQKTKNKKILILIFFLLFAQLLSGCSLTRVSEKSHAREVESLNLIGMSLDAAKEKLIKEGFNCSDYPETNRVQTQSGVRTLIQLDCSKRSLELICPQIRYAVLNVDPQSFKVVLMGKRITQQACF